jgi:hypothetical protein
MLTQATPTHLGECLSYNFSKISPFVRWKKSLIFKLWHKKNVALYYHVKIFSKNLPKIYNISKISLKIRVLKLILKH